MNATLLRRLFIAVERAPGHDLLLICKQIAQDERRVGHTKLAQELESRLDRLAAAESARKYDEPRSAQFKTFPPSKRDSLPLVQVIDRDRLRHHMVLPDVTEARFVRIELEYAARTRLANYGLRATKRVLLYGPPGCGKSLGAERLAWSTGLSLQRVRFDTLISSYFGETASNLQRVFGAAEQQPCALFLDECDTIAQVRGRFNDVGEVSRVVNTLLQLMEDFRGEGLVIAATNAFESLDPALYRRFDEVIHVPLPRLGEITRLLATSLQAICVSPDVDYGSFARGLDGLSCSDVERIAQKGAKRAVMAGRVEVSCDDIEAAAQEVKGEV